MTQEEYKYFMRDKNTGELQTPIRGDEMIEQLKRQSKEKDILEKVEESVKQLMEENLMLLKIDAYIKAYTKWTR